MGKRWILTYNVTPTLTHPSRWRGVRRRRRCPIDYNNLHGGTHVRIFSRTFFINKIFKNVFPSLDLIFKKSFTQALPTSTANPTPMPSSHPPHRVTYPAIFFRLFPSILTNLTKSFTQALPTSNSTPTLTPSSHSPPRVTYPTIFPASLPHLNKFN